MSTLFAVKRKKYMHTNSYLFCFSTTVKSVQWLLIFHHMSWCRQYHTGEDMTLTKQPKAQRHSILHHLISICYWKWACTGECSRRGCQCLYQTYAFKHMQSTGRQKRKARTSYSPILPSALQRLCEPTLASNPLLSSAITFGLTACNPGAVHMMGCQVRHLSPAAWCLLSRTSPDM